MKSKKDNTETKNEETPEELKAEQEIEENNPEQQANEPQENVAEIADTNSSGNDPQADSLTRENLKLNDLIMRERAEFANYKKRTSQEMLQMEGKIAGKVLHDMLPAFDAFDQLISSSFSGEANVESFMQGSKLIRKQLWQIFEDLGIEEINPEKEGFDPQIMEALSFKESDEVESETVTEVYQKGYKFKDKIIRPARVAVSKPAAKKE